jgi:hypothetical protein|tara:strand:+ start:298 stop:561 length:264 start_codon:yes stop_codon:yes gene_type:complete
MAKLCTFELYKRDELQVDKLNIFGTGNLRGKIIAVIGAYAGSFIGFIQWHADATIAVEPNLLFKNEFIKATESFVEDDTVIYVGKVI